MQYKGIVVAGTIRQDMLLVCDPPSLLQQTEKAKRWVCCVCIDGERVNVIVETSPEITLRVNDYISLPKPAPKDAVAYISIS